MSRPALVRLILLLLVAAAAAAGLAIALVRPVTVRQTAFPPGNDWPPRPILLDEPATVSITAPLAGLSEIWVRRAGPASPDALRGTLRPLDGSPPIEAPGEPVIWTGRDYFRFVFPPADRAAGYYVLDLSPSDGDLSSLIPLVVEAPGRFYPDGDPAERRQIAFDAVYDTAGWRVVADLAPRLGSVEGERWGPAGAVVALFGAEAVLLSALIALTRRAGRTA
jgi:hypothetical protein